MSDTDARPPAETRTTTCPFCGGNGRLTWIGLAMLGIWLVWIAFGRMLPDVWNGALILSLPALALWKWSGDHA